MSLQGGVQPRWGADGELFYLELDGTVTVTKIGSGGEASPPARLFRTHLPAWGPGPGWRTLYDVSPDGQRLIMPRQLDNPVPIRVIMNWPAAIGR